MVTTLDQETPSEACYGIVTIRDVLTEVYRRRIGFTHCNNKTTTTNHKEGTDFNEIVTKAVAGRSEVRALVRSVGLQPRCANGYRRT